MNQKIFSEWLEKLKNIWEKKSPNAVIGLCADNFLWHETPFSEPLKTKEQLLKEWNNILNQENISVSYKILCINKSMGIAQWKATFTRLPSKEEVTLDGIFQVSLNEKGECTEFHQWFNSKR